MKLITFLLTVCCLQVVAYTSAQVTYKATNKPLHVIFTEVGKITGYNFFYRVEDLAGTKNVSVDAKELSLSEFVRICLLGQGLDFYVDGKTVVIEKKKVVANTVDKVVGGKDPIEVTVRVVNEEGEPVAGVTVQEKGTKNAVATNGDGVAKIKVSSDDILVLTAVNIISIEAAVDGRKDFSVKVKGKTGKLDEVQVVAYGTTSQRISTGNVATVKAKDIEKQPVNNLLLSLQGRVTGIYLAQNNGLAGGGITVRVQGQNSIGNGNDPLYVIDGVPYISQMPATVTGGSFNLLGNSGGSFESGAGNPLSYINPSDIESIDILKDADATAIYGSRAANGAILITTKRGKAGTSKVSLNIQEGFAEVSNKVDMMNTAQYLEMRREALKNDNLLPNKNRDYDLLFWDTTRYTNWQNELIGKKANYSNYNVSLSGGSSNLQYLIGSTYHSETTVFQGNSKDSKIGFHFNLNGTSSNQKLTFQFSGNYLYDKNTLPSQDLTTQALNLAPNAPSMKNEDGSFNWGQTSTGSSTWIPPLTSLISFYENKTDNLISSLQLKYNVYKDLDVRINAGFTKLTTREFSGYPYVYTKPEERTPLSRYSYFTDNSVKSWIIEPQLNYKQQFLDGILTILLGTTFNEINTDGINFSGFGYNSDAVIRDIKSAPEVIITANLNSVYKYNAWFGRLNYNYHNKYVLNIAARRDGSTRFGMENRFHNFGSIGAAWIFSSEKFMSNINFLSFGKLRASLGTTGSDQIGNYRFMNLYTVTSVAAPYQNISSINTSGIPNPYLQWEETKKLQIGIDLGFLNEKVIFNFTFGNNRSSNQLLNYSLPLITGSDNVLRNFPATIQNRTWEFSVNSTNITRRLFSWTTNINLTIPQNKLVAFPNLSSSTYAGDLIIDEPISVTKIYRSIGVNPESGKYEFLDHNGQPINIPVIGRDNTIPVNNLPKMYGGIENSFSIKGFRLDFLFQFVKQTGFLAYQYGAQTSPGKVAINQPVKTLRRWRNKNDGTDIQKYGTNSATSFPWLYHNSSDLAYGDISFIRLKNVSLSYKFSEKPIRKIGIDALRLFVNAQNLITITKYKGLDPETKSNQMPPLRTVVFGLQADL